VSLSVDLADKAA